MLAGRGGSEVGQAVSRRWWLSVAADTARALVEAVGLPIGDGMIGKARVKTVQTRRFVPASAFS
jgi:hypothetical protein